MRQGLATAAERLAAYHPQRSWVSEWSGAELVPNGVSDGNTDAVYSLQRGSVGWRMVIETTVVDQSANHINTKAREECLGAHITRMVDLQTKCSPTGRASAVPDQVMTRHTLLCWYLKIGYNSSYKNGYGSLQRKRYQFGGHRIANIKERL
ncbi:hypothetical protein BDD12DRAFT_981205 [Trichophaea hybrida]|nr:hypothetical protein BDD12DRAFT_981205 [Trichophaea hybrida]